ncbi:MAG: hypothetical protein CVT88_03565 [Candidatus Altiarchaeales archaeon HGW-Altiarchaeales-1]|nr:MAG: hypothetical protein CVT88_03565 [Candidatus Altiarchaeales archaeon HGW-Altiarchaeales-1]
MISKINKTGNKSKFVVFGEANHAKLPLKKKTVTTNELYFLLQEINTRLENIESQVYENTMAEEITDEIEIYNNPQVMADIKETIRKCDKDIKLGKVCDINDLIE